LWLLQLLQRLLQQRLQRAVAADVGAEAPLRVRTLADAAPERCVLREHPRHLRANEPPAHAQPPPPAKYQQSTQQQPPPPQQQRQVYS
jgi:hypothetical protein